MPNRARLEPHAFSLGRLFGRSERRRPVNAQTGTTYTVLSTDLGGITTFSNTSSIAVTLPKGGTTGFPKDWSTEWVNINDGVVTITPTTSTIGGAATLKLSLGMSAVATVDASGNYAVSVKGGPAKQTIWVPSTAMVPRTDTAGGGPSTTTATAATNKNVFKSLDFDTTTQEFAQFTVAFPKGWDLGTVTFIPYWKAGSSTGGVTWGMAGLASSDNDTIDTAFGTAQTSADTFISATVIHVGPESSAITIAGTPAVGDIVAFQVNRTVADANDTLAADAQLIGIKVIYNLNASSDN